MGVAEQGFPSHRPGGTFREEKGHCGAVFLGQRVVRCGWQEGLGSTGIALQYLLCGLPFVQGQSL